ncbi:LysR substrate-binding domain-containing protein [Sorangium sp. So ce1153]|uniref:LysR substrate-binding domain-containing protein n=1 Tax=Sorangium sp. So ce1153 TaxID=3133333 RepID=UPI003F5F2893
MHGVSRVPEGLLRVSAPVSFGILKIAPLPGDFAARYPQVRLDLSLSDSLGDVVGGGFDVVVRFARQLGQEISIFVVFPHHLHQPTKVRAFVELLVERLGSESGAGAAPGRRKSKAARA